MAASATYEPIATTTLSSGSPTITFSSIPQTYTDLIFVMSITNTSSTVYRSMQFNSDTSSGSTNYSNTTLYGDGGAAGSDRQSNTYGIGAFDGTSSGSNTNSLIGNIMNYTNTNVYKTVIIRSNNRSSDSRADAVAGLWRSTAAISSITMTSANGNNYGIGTTATLYGISAA